MSGKLFFFAHLVICGIHFRRRSLHALTNLKFRESQDVFFFGQKNSQIYVRRQSRVFLDFKIPKKASELKSIIV